MSNDSNCTPTMRRPTMRVVVVTRLLNEEDIIEAMIRHHAAVVDHHIFLDNGSSDRTLAILENLIAEGKSITIFQNNLPIYSEVEFNTFLYNKAVEAEQATWVLFLDADEFIDARGVADLRSFLADVPAKQESVGVELVNYEAPSSATESHLNIVTRFPRRRRERSGVWKVFVRGDIGAGRVKVDAGNHFIFVDGVAQEPLRQRELVLAHYPSRSPLQWAGKAVAGRLKVLAAGQVELQKGRSFHYNDALAALQRHPKAWVQAMLAGGERAKTSSDFVDDPIPYLGGELKYTRLVDYGWRSLALTLAIMEQIATRFGQALDTHAGLRDEIEADARHMDLLYGRESAEAPIDPYTTSGEHRAVVRPGVNLVSASQDFSTDIWWHAAPAAFALSDAVPRLNDACAAARHTLVEDTVGETAAITGCEVVRGIAPGAIYVASISVWLPKDFRGSLVGAVILGFDSMRIVNAMIELREVWQRIWVSARVPLGVSTARPALFVIGPAGSQLFSTCWKLEAGLKPTCYLPSAAEAAPASGERPVVPAPATMPGRVYRRVPLAELTGFTDAEGSPYLPESHLEVPRPMFGTDAVATTLRRPPTNAYLLRDVVVHGQYGVVTCGDIVVAETIGDLTTNNLPGAMWLDETRLRLPDQPTAPSLAAGYYLLAWDQDNYFHWLTDVLARFNAAEFEGFGVLRPLADEPCLLRPPMDAPWKRQSFDLFVPQGLRQVELASATSVPVDRLVYIPDMIGDTSVPHRRLLAVFDRMRASAFVQLRSDPAPPWRKLFVARADHGSLGEAALATVATRAGFEPVALGSMSVAEQIRLFAEATHVVAARGAGLANVAFCRPGTFVCELQWEIQSKSAFRYLAALRGLRYGCILAEPSALAALLADPRFAGD